MNNKLNMQTLRHTHRWRLMHAELRLGWILKSQHTQVKVSEFLTFLPEIRSFCPSVLFFAHCTCLASQADALTMSRLFYHLWCTEQSPTELRNLCHTCIDHVISRNTRTHLICYHGNTYPWYINTHTHTHRRQKGVSMYMLLFDLLFIHAIMLVSCRGTAGHEHLWTVN